jgi:hypothetical protein
MVENLSLNESIALIREDLAALKTDVTWLKRLFTVGTIGVAAIFGIDLTGIAG